MVIGGRPGGPGLDAVDLTAEEALQMLPGGDTVHVLVAEGAMIGADWSRDKVEELIRDGSPELAGERATAMGHGLAVERDGRWYFIETKKADA